MTNFKASKEKEQKTPSGRRKPEQVGDDYIKAQQNLPDVIVVGGDGGGSAPTGGGD